MIDTLLVPQKDLQKEEEGVSAKLTIVSLRLCNLHFSYANCGYASCPLVQIFFKDDEK